MTEKKILVADDIFSNLLLVMSILEEAGYACKTVSDGKKLVKELQCNHYDLVLTDIEMPVMNGIEAVKYIRTLPEKYNSIPVIAMTAHNKQEFAAKIENIGFTDIVTKPYSIEKFKEILDKYLN